ncbi:putative hydrolase [Stieleria maiorica]|uniref:Putative hydrolase n=1 Tax=Stieleria maiorica TaxID=2795974 RepID=A0A5B9MIL0_9BACT|nr:HD domain-containing protein [Stieleria maiorica]QEG00300.1 putative hydrolase [Stieleria maiorica]
MTPELIVCVETIVRGRMEGQGAGHGFDHVGRVLRSARHIRAEVGGDRSIVDLAALLHDVGDAKFHDGIEKSAELSREILGELGVDAPVIDHVAHIVDNLSFRKGDAAAPLSIEGQIVQDADRLDALGAIGIVRTIEYGAVFGQPFHVSGNGDGAEKTGLRHFDDKLFKLHALLNTEPARRMARQREAFMRQFVDQFLDEWGEGDG